MYSLIAFKRGQNESKMVVPDLVSNYTVLPCSMVCDRESSCLYNYVRRIANEKNCICTGCVYYLNVVEHLAARLSNERYYLLLADRYDPKPKR